MHELSSPVKHCDSVVNPTGDMDVRLYCPIRICLAEDCYPVQWTLITVFKIMELESRPRSKKDLQSQ
jgi:hypothetical protein